MSQQNVELVREIIAAVPDWNAVSALLHPEVRFDQTRIPGGGIYEGREACGRFFERWFGTWDDIQMTPERFIEDGREKNLPWSRARVFQTRIRRNIKLAESPSFGKPIFDYDPTSNGATDYKKLAAELIEAFEGPAPAPQVEVTINPELDRLAAASPAA